MIRPDAFGYHAQAASSNAFMNEPGDDPSRISALAQSEFDDLVAALRGAGVDVTVYQDTRGLPDCVFPNNWLSWHTPQEGSPAVVTYPMFNERRREERSTEVLDTLVNRCGGADHLDLSGLEDEGEILEGTGSLVLDRVTGMAYACVSPRTTLAAFDAWCDETGYASVAFDAVDSEGQAIYHTNVILSIGERVSVVCSESVVDQSDRAELLEMLGRGGRTVIQITLYQMNSFCGNILELADQSGRAVFAMSTRAYKGFTAQQKAVLEGFGKVVHCPIPTIEGVGGGSVRCMIAEIGRDS